MYKFKKKTWIGLGTYVKDDYGRRGRVTSVNMGCPESDEWLAMQQKQSPRDGTWFSILVDGGGAVEMHEDRVREVEPFKFENAWADFYFPEYAS